MDDKLEEVIFSGDMLGYIRKSPPADVILTEEFNTYLNAQISATTDDDERGLFVEISTLIANRLQADVSNGVTRSDEVVESIPEVAEDDNIDWRERMKAIQSGDAVQLTGNEVVDKFGVFEKKKTIVSNQSVKTTDEGANKAQDVATILRKQEEAMAAAIRAQADLDARNNLEWKQF